MHKNHNNNYLMYINKHNKNIIQKVLFLDKKYGNMNKIRFYVYKYH